jgi:iron complex outermembrane recepter protein
MTTRTTSPLLLTATAAAMLTGFSPLVLADTPDAADDTVLEEVKVVATKRATNLQDTPVALSAFSATQLDEAHVTDLTGLAQFTPGLYIGGDNGLGATTMAIRGLGSLNLGIGGDEAVGVYVDGVYQGKPFGNQFDFVDVDQVEVLRGPQGTLYGRNATGGAIVINTLTPGPQVIEKVEVGVSQYDGFEAKALLSGPLIDGALYGKIAAGGSQREGFQTNPLTEERVNDISNYQVSGALRWFTDGVWDIIGRAYVGTSVPPVASKNALDGLPINTLPADFPNSARRGAAGITLTAVASLPQAVFTSTTGYTDSTDYTLTSSANVGLTQFREQGGAHELYEELRLASKDDSRFTWMLGATMFREYATDRLDYVLTPADLGAPTGLGLTFDNDLTTRSYAGFGEFGYKFTDRLSLTAGARYTHDAKDWDNCATAGGYTSIFTDYNPDLCRGKYNPESKAWSATTPHYVLNYHFTDEVFGYASVTKGFRSGGWNFTGAVNPAEPYSTAFDPEHATSYEIGAKSEWLDHRLRLNTSVYLANYTDLQVRTLDPVYHLLETRNAGTARSKGVEMQLVAKPTAPLTLMVNGDWQSARYTSFSYAQTDGVITNYAGNYMDNAPEWQFGVVADYAFALPGGATLAPRVEANYTSTVYYEETNAYPYDAGGHTLVNLRLRYTAAASNWGWQLYVENLTSRQYPLYAYAGVNNGVVGETIATPRIAGAQVFWNLK